MARMIPSHIYSQTPSAGEREIFRRLADDPNTEGWIVLHSLDIAQHTERISGEADFVIIVPENGVLCLEVKGTTRLQVKDGMWFYGNDPKPDARGPFKQASQAMHSLRTLVSDRDRQLSSIPFWSAVIFPYVQFKEPSIEWHDWQVIDGDSFKREALSKIILKLFRKARKHLVGSNVSWFQESRKEPNRDQVEHLAKLLRPNFEVYEPPKHKFERLESEVKKYTEDQFIALDAMVANPRVIFHGPAGTGKTILAIEAARRSSALGKKVLLLCYNRLLGAHLEVETEALRPRVITRTLHKHMLEIANIDLGHDPPKQDFWKKDLPHKAMESLVDEYEESNIFDEIIIDEAQDLLHEDYLDFLDLSLRGGLASGNWKIFGDFEKQAIYVQGVAKDVEDVLKDRLGNAPRFALRTNCRNTPRIAAFVHLLGGLNPDYLRVLRSDNGFEPRILYYANDTEQQDKLLATISELKQNGFTNSDITILSTRNFEHSVVSLIKSNNVKFASLEQSSRKRIGAGSIHAFKGLEKPAIIVTDFERFEGELSQGLFYVAITRALHRLYIFCHVSNKNDILNMLER